jgi:hypothetical protein
MLKREDGLKHQREFLLEASKNAEATESIAVRASKVFRKFIVG